MSAIQKAPKSRAIIFALGQLVVTANARSYLPADIVQKALERHARGDWGDLDAHDHEENELSLQEGFRLFSVYHSPDGTKFWVITEADRSSTCVLLPEDY